MKKQISTKGNGKNIKPRKECIPKRNKRALKAVKKRDKELGDQKDYYNYKVF